MPKTLKRGDTYPPITGTVSDEIGPVPLGTADSVTLLLRLDDRLVTCPLTVVDSGAERNETSPGEWSFDPGCGEWSYEWQDGDTDHIGEFSAEVEVVWDSRATPPAIETFPNDSADNDTVTFKQDLNPEDS